MYMVSAFIWKQSTWQNYNMAVSSYFNIKYMIITFDIFPLVLELSKSWLVSSYICIGYNLSSD